MGLSSISSPPSARRASRPLVTQLAVSFASRSRAARSKKSAAGPFHGDHAGVVGREPVLADQPRAFGVRKLGKAGLDFGHPGGVEFERQQVGVGEIAIVVGLFLRAHRPGLAPARIEQARLLQDLAAVLEDLDLPSRLVLDRLLDVAVGIDVLDLAARAQRAARPCGPKRSRRRADCPSPCRRRRSPDNAGCCAVS